MEDIQLLNHPYVKQSLQAKRSKKEDVDLEKEVKLPFVMKDKVLMAPGVWNNYYYTAEALKLAFDKTDWADKELTSLFLDHADKSAREWIGEVRNPHMDGEFLKGDLFIVDKPTAMKLAFGAKLGISPKVSGEAEEGTMMSFLYDNFSVVINPAVKKAYINNSEKECTCSKEMAKELDPQAKVTNKQDCFQHPEIEVSGLPKEENKMSEQPVQETKLSEVPAVQTEAPVQTEALQAVPAEVALSETINPIEAKLQDACAKVEEYGKLMAELSAKIAQLEEDMAKVKDLNPDLKKVIADQNPPNPEPAKLEMTETPAPVTQEMQQVEVTLDHTKAEPVGKRSFYMSQNSASEADLAFYDLLRKL